MLRYYRVQKTDSYPWPATSLEERKLQLETRQKKMGALTVGTCLRPL